MDHWTLDDIPWDHFDRSAVGAETIALVKASCMVEHNGAVRQRVLLLDVPADVARHIDLIDTRSATDPQRDVDMHHPPTAPLE